MLLLKLRRDQKSETTGEGTEKGFLGSGHN